MKNLKFDLFPTCNQVQITNSSRESHKSWDFEIHYEVLTNKGLTKIQNLPFTH